MCGIVVVMRGPGRPAAPGEADVLAPATAALDAASAAGPSLIKTLKHAGDLLKGVDARLRGIAGLQFLVENPDAASILDKTVAGVEEWVAAIEAGADETADESRAETADESRAETADESRAETADESRDEPADESRAEPAAGLEAVNAALVRLKDVCWGIRHDRIASAAEVDALAGPGAPRAAVEAYAAIETALSALDRLELRGRDSSGLHVMVTDHGLDPNDPDDPETAARSADRLFTSGSVRRPGGLLSFVYKAANEIGSLGDNGRALRAEIVADPLLRAAVQSDRARVAVLGHTRWASVGLINQANAHPLNQEEEPAGPQTGNPYVIAALNGDVDNYQELVSRHGLTIAGEITTDAKVIPVLVSHRLAAGMSLEEAFRTTVAEFDGSVAVAAAAAEAPHKVLLAMRGSGQALYVGIGTDQYVVASEPYGVVEECGSYLRLDGESTAAPDGRKVPAGQIVVLDAEHAGDPARIRRIAYDGTDLAVGSAEFKTAEITTRDIDLRGFPHFLRKEIGEAPLSLRKTLRGRVGRVDGRLKAILGLEAIPPAVKARLAAGEIRRVVVIGQGTAAVAGAGVAAAVGEALAPLGIPVSALAATELSGFRLGGDMSDLLAIAVSQSGTTTDTNRTVDLVRSRGAAVLAIVNRRGSDLTHKSDGFLYTSDGRDVEMSVASTKAFYAQIAAGQLLALALADAAGCGDPARAHELLQALAALPDAMRRVLDTEPHIRRLAQAHAPRRRSWAVVGNGRNLIAAQEIRIKLSELCYKAVACDVTEDKKHIDLSSEPLTLVCAAGLVGSAADDVAKEIGIFRAHKGAPVVIATEGEDRFGPAEGVIAVPRVHPSLAYVLSAMAGHLFGYHAALAIDEHALPLRRARAAIERNVTTGAAPDDLLQTLSSELAPITVQFAEHLRRGDYDATLEAATAGRIVMGLQSVVSAGQWGAGPLGIDRSPSESLDELAAALTRGIDELTRPIDAIKHQAKTVTVGISRSDEAYLNVRLVRELLATGVDRAELPYVTIRAVAALDPAVAEATGYTRYELDGAPDDPRSSVRVVAKGGIAAGLTSRTDADPRLRGTKQLVAMERQPLVAVGRNDGRSVLIVPLMGPRDGSSQVTGLALLHLRFEDQLPSAQARQVLDGYRGRLAALRSTVTETESTFDEHRLAEIPPIRLLTDPILVLAEHWRT